LLRRRIGCQKDKTKRNRKQSEDNERSMREIKKRGEVNCASKRNKKNRNLEDKEQQSKKI